MHNLLAISCQTVTHYRNPLYVTGSALKRRLKLEMVVESGLVTITSTVQLFIIT